MEDSCKTKSPAVHRQNGGRQGGPGGKVRARFLGSFFAAWQRMNIKKPTRSARAEGSQYERTAAQREKNQAKQNHLPVCFPQFPHPFPQSLFFPFSMWNTRFILTLISTKTPCCAFSYHCLQFYSQHEEKGVNKNQKSQVINRKRRQKFPHVSLFQLFFELFLALFDTFVDKLTGHFVFPHFVPFKRAGFSTGKRKKKIEKSVGG